MRRYPSKVVETSPKKKETDALCIWEKEIDSLSDSSEIASRAPRCSYPWNINNWPISVVYNLLREQGKAAKCGRGRGRGREYE